MVTVLKLMYNIIIINITEEFCNGKIKENGKKTHLRNVYFNSVRAIS